MKTLAIILVAGGAGALLGYLVCAILTAGEMRDRCLRCLFYQHEKESPP